MDGAASRNLFSKVDTGTKAYFRIHVGSTDSVSVTRCMDRFVFCQMPEKIPARLLDGSFGRQDSPYTVADRT